MTSCQRQSVIAPKGDQSDCASQNLCENFNFRCTDGLAGRAKLPKYIKRAAHAFRSHMGLSHPVAGWKKRVLSRCGQTEGYQKESEDKESREKWRDVKIGPRAGGSRDSLLASFCPGRQLVSNGRVFQQFARSPKVPCLMHTNTHAHTFMYNLSQN